MNMDNSKQPYDVRASIMVRHIVLQGKRDGQLQRLKQAYEQLQLDQLPLEFNKKLIIEPDRLCKKEFNDGVDVDGGGGVGAITEVNMFKRLNDEDIFPMAKRRRIEDVKRRLRAVLHLHSDGTEQSDKFKEKI